MNESAQLSLKRPAAQSDEHFMSRALTLAAKGVNSTHPNPRVGCVIVADGEIVGEGWHRAAGEAHAETIALQAAGERARGASMFVTLEPCTHQGNTPPCANAVAAAGIRRAVIAMRDPNPQASGGIDALRDCGIEVAVGVGEAAARKLNRGFERRMTENFPWVTVKMAISLDGKTALSNGMSQWITKPAARQDAHQLRAASSAILTGVGTVLKDNPTMTARTGEELLRQPMRVIVDSQLRTPVDAKILAAGEVLIFTANDIEAKTKNLHRQGVEIITAGARPLRVIPDSRKRSPESPDTLNKAQVDLTKVMTELAAREVNEVIVEAGAELNGNLLQAGLVNEIILYMSPDLLGDTARGMFNLPALEELSQRYRLKFADIKMIGDDLRICLDVPVGEG